MQDKLFLKAFMQASTLIWNKTPENTCVSKIGLTDTQWFKQGFGGLGFKFYILKRMKMYFADCH